MAEMERTRTRQKGARPDDEYEFILRVGDQMRERSKSGTVVIKPSDREWRISRQGRLLFHIVNDIHKDVVLQDWRVFTQDIKTHSGKHRHQGGLVIYVIEGSGYSIVNGERKDWEAGDLLLLPLVPGGVEHQHFNLDKEKGCKWIAFVQMQIFDHLGSFLEQVEESPLYKEMYG